MKTPDRDMNVLTKTPEEIKKALYLCSESGCPDCNKCAYDGNENCLEDKSKEALAYIQQLESRLAQVERERDAAVADIRKASSFLCRVCTKNDWPNCAAGRNNLYSDDVVECEDFEWRGVCEENTTPETTNEVRKDDTEN